MDETNPNLDAALEGVDENKRSALRRLILKGVFVTPIVATVAMSGLRVEMAAAASNTTASGKAISDRRLKAGITRVGTHQAGFGIYRFKYLWSNAEHVGVLAQEVLDAMPHAVIHGDDGFLRVDYAAIDMELVAYTPASAQTEPAQRATAA